MALALSSLPDFGQMHSSRFPWPIPKASSHPFSSLFPTPSWHSRASFSGRQTRFSLPR